MGIMLKFQRKFSTKEPKKTTKKSMTKAPKFRQNTEIVKNFSLKKFTVGNFRVLEPKNSVFFED